MRVHFVTGTDTGAGKTTVVCALLAAARARGLRAVGVKPVESGCTSSDDGRLLAADAIALHAAAAGDASPPQESDSRVAQRSELSPEGGTPPTTLYRLRAPLAPAVAAEREGITIDLAALVRSVDHARSRRPDLLLIEGAGGLLVPLAPELTIADLAVAIGEPILIVARDGLGTINHTLLTVEAVRARGLVVAGIVLTATTDGTSAEDAQRNALEIAHRGGVRVIGRLPRLSPAELSSPGALGAAAEAHLDLSSFFDV